MRQPPTRSSPPQTYSVPSSTAAAASQRASSIGDTALHVLATGSNASTEGREALAQKGARKLHVLATLERLDRAKPLVVLVDAAGDQHPPAQDGGDGGGACGAHRRGMRPDLRVEERRDGQELGRRIDGARRRA